MLAHSFRHSLTQDLLQRAQEHRFLSPVAAQRVHSLLEHGLHLEQALLGTGLLTREQYRLVFQEVTGDVWEPVVRRGEASTDDVFQAVRQSRAILYQLASASFGAVHTVAGKDVHSFRLDERAKDAGHHRVEVYVQPAVTLRVSRRGAAAGYRPRLSPSPNGMILHLERAETQDHPHEWMDALQRFLTEPIGILLIRRPDAFMEDWIQTHLPPAESSGAWREERQPVSIWLSSPHAAELLEQAALLDRPVLAVERSMPNEAQVDWQNFVSQGTLVHVIQSHPSPSGRAWSSYPL